MLSDHDMTQFKQELKQQGVGRAHLSNKKFSEAPLRFQRSKGHV